MTVLTGPSGVINPGHAILLGSPAMAESPPASSIDPSAVPFTLLGTGAPSGTTTTFGQAFLPGYVPVGSSVIAKRADGTLLSSQIDIIKTGSDGTPTHAVLHVAAPALPVGATEVCTLAVGTPPAGTTINLIAALAGRAASVTITPTASGGTPWTCDLIASLPAPRWWSGPLASQARVALPIPAAAVGGVTSARLLADLTLTADGVLGVSLAIRNDACLRDNGGAGYSNSTASSIAFTTPISPTQNTAALAVDSFQINGGTVNYANGTPATLTNPVITTYGQTATITYQITGSVTVTGYPYVLMKVRGGTAAYGITLTGDGVIQMSYPGISAPLYTAFLRERRWTMNGAAAPKRPRVHHDLTYLARVGVAASYDQPLGYNPGFMNQYVALLADPNWDVPYASRGLSPDMGATGGRPDIGFTTECNVGWLMTGDDTLRQVAIGQAEASGDIPWHAWSVETGAWVNQADHANVWAFDGRGGFFPQSSGSQFSLDGAHQPDASFMPALLTGRRAFLDNVAAQGSFAVMGRWNAPRGQSTNTDPSAAGQAARMAEIRGSGVGVLFALQDQMRGQAWGLRQLAEAAWLVSASEQPHGTFFQDVAEAQLRYWANDIPSATTAQGETAGSIRQWDYGSDNGALATWQHHYIVAMVVRAARLGMAHAQDVLLWTNGWTAGCFLNSPAMLAEDGIAYNLPRGAIGDAHQPSYAFFTTWTQIGNAFASHAGNSSGSYGASFSNVTTQDIQTDYGQSASAVLALIHDYLVDKGLDHARIDAALAVVNAFPAVKAEMQPSNFADSPKWSVTPREVTRKV